MTLKKSGRQNLQYLSAPIAVADLGAAGSTIGGKTVEIGDLPPDAIPLPAVVLGTPFNGTTLITIGLAALTNPTLAADPDALGVSGTITAGAVGAGAQTYIPQTRGKTVTVTLTSTSTITTGDIRIAVPYLQDSRVDTVYGGGN